MEAKMNKGKIKEKYQFESQIGEGQNVVVLGYNLKTGEEVAIKVVKLAEMNQHDLDYLLKETQILSEVDHPNIVELKEVFENDDIFYMIFELMKGGTLAEAVADDGFMKEDKAAILIHEIVDALRYCHSVGITHRDLKPENILRENMDEDSTMKISDFGMASVSGGADMMSTICGSKDYIAPEVIQGEKYDSSCDCWQLGVIIFYLLSGSVPFYRESEAERFEAIKNCEWQFQDEVWEDISDEAKNLIENLLVSDPQKRLNADEIFDHDWFDKYV